MSQEQLIDLDKKQLRLLKKIIKQHIPDKTVWAYGSRVTWKADEISDLDLTVFDCSSIEIYTLKEALEESNLLISVDVMNWTEIPENFRKNIKRKYVVLQEEKKLKGWREVKLGNVVSKIVDNRGKTPPTTTFGHALLEVNAIAHNSKAPDYSKVRKYVSLETYSNWFRSGHPELGDILVPTVGTIGNVALLLKIGSAIAQNLIAIRINSHNSSNYIYYFLKSPLGKEAILNLDIGGVQPSVKVPHLLELNISLPPLPEQKAIAEVLSSLDDKIDLLHRQNKTLEDLAQTLFRQWFIEEANEGWEVGSLGEVVENFDNKRIPTSKMKRDKMKEGKLYPYYGAATIMDYVNDYIFDGEYILMAEDGTVKTDDSYPVLQHTEGKFWVNNHTHVLKARTPYNNSFIWHFLLKLNIENIITGAVQPKINQGNLNAIPFPQYPLNLVNKFQEQVKSAFKKALSNQSQICTLENLRDTLLPKLMSGEVGIK